MKQIFNNIKLKTIVLMSFLMTIAVFISCEDPEESGLTIATTPIAAFTATEGSSWDTFTFKSTSSNATSYAWDFDDEASGDDNTTTGEEVTHVFSDQGTYDVLLTAKDERGASSSATVRVRAINPNATDAMADFEVTEGDDWQTYVFTSTSVNADTFTWDFGDAASGSENTASGSPVTHTFSGEGSFTVTLTATDGVTTDTHTETVITEDPAAEATVAAVILNGSIDEYDDTNDTPVGAHKDDNNDAWETDPPNSLKGGDASPYSWDNEGLSGLGLKAAGITTTEHTGNYAMKFDSDTRRAYQPFAVEVGVTYTIKMWVRTESADAFNVYILNNEVQDETDLAGNSDKVFTITDGTNEYIEYTFTFTATATTAVFYAVPFTGISSSTEVFLDDISIETPGFTSGGGGGGGSDAITPTINDGGFDALRVYSDGSAADGQPDFNGKTSIQGSSDAWKIGSFTGGNSNPYSSTSDGLDLNYDGTDFVDRVVTDGKDPSVSATQTKSRAAKWDTGGSKNQQTNPDGSLLGSDSRYAYQALTVTPNTSYTVTYWYAFEKSAESSTGSMVVEILDGHFTDGADAIAATPIATISGNTPGTSDKEYKEATGTFTSNSSGDISLWIYATSTVADNDVFIDNIHVVPTP